ncbi:NADH dehydrogenase subunit M [Anseongella ginsenosidimutans]|uniref:NADH dehydrogenase subunit M n=1 Tax=Anseongella ginsenosidimutans TaxID=496056 RepID=A0A4R3KPZ8_9SPHI|nr:NADH-quinone oxidoreductase subunit M [Anseongella ginsenosidimutans]QEC52277.1 NADH-quinone oxidoreductase subunit M [Anseongella ginsenosidimutans]TCS86834.1 NADH dehydrogenase subunit M [Anseongella ginsenosidimutans]
MILAWLILILLTGGLLSWLIARWNVLLARYTALAAVLLDFAIALGIWLQNPSPGEWITDLNLEWIPRFGIRFHLALDGLSLLMLLLTFFLGALGVLCSWKEIRERPGFFHFNLLWVLAGITGVFLTMDLFLFYFFWEVMLIPMYFLIGIWGHANRIYAAYKFFIFTQASGLFMLLAILGLYFIQGQSSGNYSFDYFDLLGTELPAGIAGWLMGGFLLAFIVKLPAFPFHNWLPDAHGEAPTAGSLVLAGLLLKTGAYGLIRFVLPLFPEQAMNFAPWGMLLGVIGILYGGKLAFAQTDLKRLIAYTSVSHMGFVMLGVFAFTEMALQGVVMQMITHGISTGALFLLAGMLYERTHTRDITQMGGLWKGHPALGAAMMVFVMASLGLPGLGNFIAEFLTLNGTWPSNRLMTVLAATGLVIATIYSLRIMQKVFFGQTQKEWEFPDMRLREYLIMMPLVAAIIWLGLFPQKALETSENAIMKLNQPGSVFNISPGAPALNQAENTLKIQPGEKEVFDERN